VLLFGDWSDKDTIGALGTATTGLVVALSVLVVRYLRGRGENDAKAAEAENRREELLQKGDARTFGEMRTLLRHQQQWINDRDKKIEELAAEVAECRERESAGAAREAALIERVVWLEEATGKPIPPRSHSDEVRIPKPGGG
jgi:uncharacterized protein HemX